MTNTKKIVENLMDAVDKFIERRDLIIGGQPCLATNHRPFGIAKELQQEMSEMKGRLND